MDVSTQKVMEIPQWKKDLIARLRNSQNKSPTTLPLDQQLNSSPQLSLHCETSVTNKSSSVTDASVVTRGCSTSCRNVKCVKTSKMVQERNWVDSKHLLPELDENGSNGYHHKSEDSDSEDLHYGPGIVKKLKNKYLSLALRESNSRPTILHLRKATSLENVLDDDGYNENRHFLSRANGDAKNTIPNRYRNADRREMKRARSVETISRLDSAPAIVHNNRQSLHEDMLTTGKDGNTYQLNKLQDNKYPVDTNDLENKLSNRYINRPKRIQPLMNEKEKPPADFVKQAKKIFEAPEQRTRQPRQTGDVAAKVDSYNNIIVKAKVEAKISRKNQIKHNKPVLNDKLNIENRSKVTKTIGSQTKPIQQSNGKNNHRKKSDDITSLPSPSLEISRNEYSKSVEDSSKKNGVTDTKDVNSIPKVLSPRLKDNSVDIYHQEEGRNTHSPDQNYSKKITSPILSPNAVKPASPLLMPIQNNPVRPPSPLVSPNKLKSITDDDIDANSQPINNVTNNANNKLDSEIVPQITTTQNHQPMDEIYEKKIPPSQPLFIKVNGVCDNKKPQNTKPSKVIPRGPPKFSPPPPPTSKLEHENHHVVVPPSADEIANNLKNSNENINKPVEVVNKNLVAKKTILRDQPASIVFKFTDRKGVPDYILNDKSRSPSRPELPKPGEGGIIMLPTANLAQFQDDDDELIRSVDGPPSPCDVTFINDNILIDGKSCFIRKSKDVKLNISFQDDADIYEYPSESSMMLDESFSSSPVNHMVPQLSGSSLANYTPKGTEEFQPGITRSVQQSIPVPNKQDINDVEQSNDLLLLKEADTPFSSGTNSDILF